jgi:hypothetical protein
VHLVTLLEEMPVQETADGIAELREAKIPVGAVVVNLAEQSPLDAEALTAASGGTLPRDDFTKALRETGLSADDETVTGLLTDAREHAVRVELENELRAQVAALGRPTYELPRLTDGVDLGALFELSHALTAQGMA